MRTTTATAIVLALALASPALALHPLGHVKHQQPQEEAAPAEQSQAAEQPAPAESQGEEATVNEAASAALAASGQQQQQQAMQAPGHAKWFLQGMDKMPEGFNPSQIGGGQAAGLEGGSAEGGMAPPAPGLGEQGPGMPPAPPQGEGMGEDAPMAGGPPLGGEPEQQMPPPMGLLQLRGAGQRVQFKTTKGPITVTLRPDWAPRGVDHLSKLVKSGFYDNTAFFRVLTGFIAQWGIAADPSTNKKWETPIEDDKLPEGVSNSRGTVTFATAGPNTRTTQLFINLADNVQLDGMGFTPIGQIDDQGMAIAEALYAGYGEGAPSGNGPDQGRIMQEGNSYLKASFPDLDYCTSASFA